MMSKRGLAVAVLGVAVSLAGLATSGCELSTFSEDARRKGLQMYNQGNYTDAAGSFQNAVKQRPTDYQSQYYLGQSYEKLDQMQRAIQCYKSARDTQLQTTEGIQDKAFRDKILDALAMAIGKAGNREQEVELLRARSATSRNGEDLVEIARVFKFGGDPDSAIATYDEAIAKYPREHAILKEYGFYLQSLGLKDKAREVLTAATKIRLDRDVDKALKDLNS